MWIDCHAHLDRLPEKELAGILNEAEAAGVSTVLSTATDIPSAVTVVRQCRIFPALYGAAGISPFEVFSLPDDWEEQLRTLCANERMVAVGEIGLDKSNPKYPDIKYQMPVFERQILIAKERGLTAVIHSRGAEKQAAEICRSLGIQKALFHCFTGSLDSLRAVLNYGYALSFSGIITFNETVRESVRYVPLDRLFIETDTPFLAPVPHRGKTNRPGWVALVGETVARIKGVPVERLQEVIQENFKKLFLPLSSKFLLPP